MLRAQPVPLRQFQVLDRKVELSAGEARRPAIVTRPGVDEPFAEARMLVRERGFRVVLD